MNTPVSFIHISDTHLGPSKDFKLNDAVNTYTSSQKAIQAILDSKLQYDFIIHTGDVAAVDGTQEDYKIAAELFASFTKPVYYVTGNHDTSSLMKNILKFGPLTYLSDEPDRLFYQFEVNNHLYIVLDAKAPKEQDPHGQLPEEHLAKLETILKTTDKLVTIFVHFPVQMPNVPWLKEKMNILNEEKILEVLKKYSSKIAGVFSGHIHKGIMKISDEILYSTVGSTCMQFRNNPDDTDVIFTSSNNGFFNHVTISGNSIEIKEYSFVNDSGVYTKTREEMTGH